MDAMCCVRWCDFDKIHLVCIVKLLLKVLQMQTDVNRLLKHYVSKESLSLSFSDCI